MLWGLIIAIFLSVTSINAQSEPLLTLPAGVTFKNATPQQLADAVSIAVKSEPAQVGLIFEKAIQGAMQRGFPESDEVRNAVSAMTCAMVAVVPPESLKENLTPALNAFPAFSKTIIKSVLATNPALTASALGVEPEMNLGNIRVLKVDGGSAEILDSLGAASNLKAGDFLRQGSKIVTGPKASVSLVFENGCIVQVNPQTEFFIDQFTQEPFDGKKFNYQKLDKEPACSHTTLSVSEGSIFVDVAKLNKNSSYQVSTPLGVAGIRGTSFYVASKFNDKSAPVAVGVAEGKVQFTTFGGESRPISQGEAIGVSRTSGGIGLTSNPAGFSAMLVKTAQAVIAVKQSTMVSPFIGAPPAVPAPPTPLSKLSTSQQGALKEAAQKNTQTLVETAQKLIQEQPSVAPEISSAAASLMPSAAVEIAVNVVKIAPFQVGLIAGGVSEVVPSQAPAIASALASVAAPQTLAVAYSVSRFVPLRASEIAVALTLIAPAQSALIIATIGMNVPSQSIQVSQAVYRMVPPQGDVSNSGINQNKNNTDSEKLSKDDRSNKNPSTMASPTATPKKAPVSPSY
jgi:hypothetical protein